MRGRPKLENSRTHQYRIRLNEEENSKLAYASKATGKAKSEIIRLALMEYYNNVLLNEIIRVEDSGWNIDSITLKRVVNCPYCNHKTKLDIENNCTASCEERTMGTETVYEFDYNDICIYCDKFFNVSGYISEYPAGALNFEKINISLLEEEE